MDKLIKNFDIRQIMNSGQCFRIKELQAGEFLVISGRGAIIVFQDNSNPTMNGFYFNEDTTMDEWTEYFDLNTDYEKIINNIDLKDKELKNAALLGSGIRILKQDLFETIISYLISQNNNIPRISASINAFAEKWGKKKKIFDIEYSAFPTFKDIKDLELSDLKDLNLGYRDEYIISFLYDLKNGKISLKELEKMDYQEARKTLMKENGIGPKVADCICLYGLHHLEAFPVDTHIKKLVETKYKDVDWSKYDDIKGVLQQYMFFEDLGK